MEKIVSIKKQITADDIGKNAIFPYYNSGIEYVNKIKNNTHILLSYSKPRNPDHHALIFALAKCTIDNLPDSHIFAKSESYEFIKAVMLEINQVDYQQKLDGEIIAIPRSLKFESMSEDEFQPISDAIFKVCADQLKISVQELEKNYIKYL